MAYKKLLELPSGVSAEYWRITKIEIDKDKPDFSIVVRGYKNKAVRDSGAPALMSKTYSMPTNLINFSEDIYAQAYEYIKDKPEDGKRSFNPFNKTIPQAFFADAEIV